MTVRTEDVVDPVVTTDAAIKPDPVVEQAAQTDDDIFTKAFDDLAALSNPDAPAAKTDAPVVKADVKVDTQAAPVTTDFVDPAKVVAPEQKAPDPVVKPEPQAPALSDEEVVKRLGSLLNKPAPAEQPAAQQQAQEPVEQPIVAPPMTREEFDLVSQYEADFPDVSKAEQIKRRAENNVIVQHVFREVTKALAARDEAIQMLLERTQLADLKQAVPTYDSNLRSNVVAWVEKQPAYLRQAYNNVITSGTVEEVKDLVTRYEQANGKPAGAAAPPVTRKPAAELPAATKQAVEALAPVGSKRSTVVQGLPQTFDDAFDAFAKSS